MGKKEKQTKAVTESSSKFTGGVGTYLCHAFGGVLLVLITIGLATPWVIVSMQKWKINNTVVDGKPLAFDATGGGLFGKWILWIILCVITIGIYSFFIPVKLEQWRAEHTHFASAE
jgi:uncharacterized membrane protein YjgN (DUF898 family)